MIRYATVVVLIMLAVFLFFNMTDRGTVAAEEDSISRILENQKAMIEKLNVMDKKLDQLKMRIRQ